MYKLTKLCVKPPNVAELITVEIARNALIHFSLRKAVACLARLSVIESTGNLSLLILSGVTLLGLDKLEVLSVSTFLYSFVVIFVRFREVCAVFDLIPSEQETAFGSGNVFSIVIYRTALEGSHGQS